MSRRPLRQLIPKAALWAVAASLGLSLACWLGVWLATEHGDRNVVLIGDSFTGNYRFEVGERIEDRLQTALGPQWRVWNAARPGARTLDMLLQLHQARTLHGDPDLVVLPLFVTKFAVDKPYLRLDKRGDNLKWLRLDSAAGPVLDSLDTEHWKKLAIHKAGLLVGFYDLLEYAWIEAVQSPNERAAMRAHDAGRARAIEAKIASHAREWQRIDPTAPGFADGPAARDLDLLVTYARTERIPLLILLIPVGNMDAVARVFSPLAQQHLEQARQVTRAWCERRGVAAVDLTDAIPGRTYDDFTHLNRVDGNDVLASAVAGFVRGGGIAATTGTPKVK
jgi:hypothetical protein